MKVAIVNQPWNHAPPAKGGSIAIWTWEVARRLASFEAIREVYVYARRNPGQPEYEEIQGVRCVRYSIDNDLKALKLYSRLSKRLGIGRYPFKSPLFYRFYMGKVARDLGERGLDVIHLHNFSQHVPIVRARNPKAKIILHMHCEWLTQLHRATIAGRLAHADAVFGCSGYIAGKIRDRFPEYADRCHVVFNGVDVDVFTPTDRKGGDADKRQRLLFVGRVTPEKAIHELIEAVAMVTERVPDVRLEIVGPDAETPKEYIVDLSDDDGVKALESWYDGNYYERLKRLGAAKLGDRIRFVGLVPPDAIADRYRLADLLLNPSLSESFGMSLVEAMSCGVPVIATRVGGMPEIVDHGRTGLLAKPGDPVALSDTIAGLLRDAPLRATMSEACRRRVVELFSWDRVAERVAGRYAAAVEERR